MSASRKDSVPLLWIAGAAGLAIGLAFIVVLKSARGLLIGAWLTSVALAIRLAVLRVRKMPLDLPYSPGRALVGRAALVASLAPFVLLSAMREGLLGDVFAFDVTLGRTHQQSSFNANWSDNVSTHGPRTSLRGQALSCHFEGRGDVADGFRAGLAACPEGVSPNSVDVVLEVQDAFCFTPLVKTATVRYTARVLISWNSSTTNGTGTIDVMGEVKQTTWGVGSCRGFNQAVGAQIEKDVAGQINVFVANH